MDSNTRQLVLQEVQLLEQIKHPNIVEFYGFEEDSKNFKIYMEYMDEGSVSSMIENYGALKESIVVSYLKQILDGLEYLHCKKVIHRDIKGGNILIKSNGTVKIGDIGSAKII